MKQHRSCDLRVARSLGFTLIELMVAVAIVAVLAVLAYESYQNSLFKARRADAKTSLLDLASREERYFSVNNQYAGVGGPVASPSALGLPGATFPIPVQSGSQVYYTMTVAVPNPQTVPPSWSATATPQGNQVNDSCGSYTLNQLGVQATSTAASGCW